MRGKFIRLLRINVDRKRNKNLFRSFFSFYALIASVIVATQQGCGPKDDDTAPDIVSSAAASMKKPVNPGSAYFSHVVKNGETIAGILQNTHMHPAYSARLFRALRKAGLSTVYPGDSLALTTDTNHRPLRFALVNRLKYLYHASFTDSSVCAVRQPLAVTVSREILKGTLETSLFDALQQSGLGPYLACRISDIFAWDIDFFLDPRRGDTFQVLFTRKFVSGRCVGYGDILAARYSSVSGTDYHAIGFPDSSGTFQYYDLNGGSVQKEFLKAPLRYSRISSGFTYKRMHPIRGIVVPHLGIDYAAPRGTPVYSAADGTVQKSGYDRNYGNFIEISHGGGLSTSYGHLSTISTSVKKGRKVLQGQLIGTVGATGLATGPHLDYRMKRHHKPVNPITVNLPSRHGINKKEKENFNRTSERCSALLENRLFGTNGHLILDFSQ